MKCPHVNCLVYHPNGVCNCDMARYCAECKKDQGVPMSNSTQNDCEKLVKKIEEQILELFIDDKKGQFQYKGKWYSPIWGCDTINFIVDVIFTLVDSELSDARREVKNDYDNRMFTIDSLKRTCKHCGVIRGVKLHEDTDSHDRYQIGYNKAIDDVLATLREEEKDYSFITGKGLDEEDMKYDDLELKD